MTIQWIQLSSTPFNLSGFSAI
ncbi:hypothetical protein EMIT0357P_20682 [Pseudomonas marginalis]